MEKERNWGVTPTGQTMTDSDKGWREKLEEGKLIGMHGVDSMIDEHVVWNFEEEEFHEFMEEQGYDQVAYYWTPQEGSKAARYHTEHRVNRHFIAQRRLRGGEWIYSKTWDSLEEFKKGHRSNLI